MTGYKDVEIKIGQFEKDIVKGGIGRILCQTGLCRKSDEEDKHCGRDL